MTSNSIEQHTGSLTQAHPSHELADARLRCLAGFGDRTEPAAAATRAAAVAAADVGPLGQFFGGASPARGAAIRPRTGTGGVGGGVGGGKAAAAAAEPRATDGGSADGTRLLTKYGPMRLFDFVAPGCAVVVEQPWLRVMERFPNAMVRHQFGT